MYLIYATSHHHCPTIFWCIWLSLSDLQSSDHQSGNNSGKAELDLASGTSGLW
jgi:hypothetical protein